MINIKSKAGVYIICLWGNSLTKTELNIDQLWKVGTPTTDPQDCHGSVQGLREINPYFLFPDSKRGQGKKWETSNPARHTFIAAILLLLHIGIKFLWQNQTLLLTEDPKLGQVAEAPQGCAARDLSPWKSEQAGTSWKGHPTQKVPKDNARLEKAG